MKRSLSLILALALCLGIAAPAGAFASESEEMTIPLYVLAEPYGFKMGGAFGAHQMNDSAYLDMLKGDFNSVTTTNEMKAYSLLDKNCCKLSKDGMPVMNYFWADKMVAWAQENGIKVRGHVLVWDAYMSDFFFHEGYDTAMPLADRETMLKRMEYYIHDVITHFETKFPGVVYCWDVVNEAVGDNAGEFNHDDPRHLRTTRNGGPNLFYEYVGDDYVEYAFLYARNTVDELGADIKLFYNDYNAFFPEKREAICALVNSVNNFATDENGNPRKLLDGVGMQGYIGGYGYQEGCLEDSHLENIRLSIQAYAELGVEVQITEMAVRNFEPDEAAKHAEYYGHLFQIFKEVNSGESKPLTCVTIWGLTDIPYEPKGTYNYNLNSPYGGLFTEKYERKDAYKSVYTTLLD
ncbi:MAG: endo-1,4-beta-xylanase [Clostridiales bacterium]|nr:endo-1,4-beta-xylanase [Clostridiales bacterium]